ncbi:LCP family protein [Enterococcus alcedinis]|uniref:LytR family transcriptional regulator n=1 Tax=Enterococcus alcedinis TaxID=1274384 RepID=A0A917JFU3_9ENTE|nr:LCP family protein [Enterococcus alcedinis]MBP2101187.1 LCP family protein required for cell wall assembly [Enterococcus alcedinis]GGI64514.1 LytR family transcriptional regulator [Enterococcus alcedinis]
MRTYQKVVVSILSAMVVMIAIVTGYGMKVLSDANKAVDTISQQVDRETKKREVAVSFGNKDPFSILLLGIDTGALGRSDHGRSDSMMVVTVNPEKKQTTIVSLDRDILSDMLDGVTFDKLNHAYAYGDVELAMDVVEKLVDVPIDHYVMMNMQGLRDLIDAVGGIQVNNKIDFTLEKVHVPAGKITLDGKTGLAYARMRKEDPEGDIGRQRRQREVITKIVDKLLSLDSVSNYQKILKAVEKNSRTDLVWNEMLDIVTNYYPAFENIEQAQLEGQGEQINGIYYQILGVNELLKVQNLLKEQLEIPTNEELEIDPQFEYSFNGFIGNQFYDDRDYSSVESVEETFYAQ